MTGYTPEDVRTVLRALAAKGEGLTPYVDDWARIVLEALAAAGRLLPADTRTEVSFGVRWPDGMVSSDFLNAESARAYAHDKTVLHPGQAVTRTVWVGPWVPVPEPELVVCNTHGEDHEARSDCDTAFPAAEFRRLLCGPQCQNGHTRVPPCERPTPAVPVPSEPPRGYSAAEIDVESAVQMARERGEPPVSSGAPMLYPTRRPGWLSDFQSWPCGRCGADVDDDQPHPCAPAGTPEETREACRCELGDPDSDGCLCEPVPAAATQGSTEKGDDHG